MFEFAVRVFRRIGGPAVVVAWVASAVIALWLPTTPRSGEVADLADALALALTVGYAVERLGRAHLTDVKWALTNAEDRADQRLLKLRATLPRSGD